MGVVAFMHGRWVWLPVCPQAVFDGTSTVGNVQFFWSGIEWPLVERCLYIIAIISATAIVHTCNSIDPLVGGSIMGGSTVKVI